MKIIAVVMLIAVLVAVASAQYIARYGYGAYPYGVARVGYGGAYYGGYASPVVSHYGAYGAYGVPAYGYGARVLYG